MNTTEQVTNDASWITNHKGKCMIGLIAIILLSYYILKKYKGSLKEDKDLLEVFEEEKKLVINILQKWIIGYGSVITDGPEGWYNFIKWYELKDELSQITIKILYLEKDNLYYERKENIVNIKLAKNKYVDDLLIFEQCIQYYIKLELEQYMQLETKTIALLEKVAKDTKDLTLEKLQKYIQDKKGYKEMKK